MKAVLAIFVMAVACLTASSLAWLYAANDLAKHGEQKTEQARHDPIDVAAHLSNFVKTRTDSGHSVEVDIASRYANRLELVDPRRALPTWHQYDRAEAVAVYAAIAQCPPRPLSSIHDASLAKAYDWHARTCQLTHVPDNDPAFDSPPFMHPSGKSYAALALSRGTQSREWTRTHMHAFHVLELRAVDPESLAGRDRALAALTPSAWEALTRGDGVVLTDNAFVMANHAIHGLAKIRIYPREDWELFAENASIQLVRRESSTLCIQSASPNLCWRRMAPAERHRTAFVRLTAASAAFTVCSGIALLIFYVRERRRADRDRIHVLRTLTHELRTPATTLRLDIEPLREAYDELPPQCQEPILRISDGIERLQRVLHRSARYMALFETPDLARARLVNVRTVPSVRALFDELSEEWPDDVMLAAESDDGAFATDPEWLGLAIKNLVENAARHGQVPIVVSWLLNAKGLIVRVRDGGKTAGFSLRRAIAPFHRADNSPGLGLGLAIVKRVAELLGGGLSHEPAPTVFQLVVPSEER